jgi:hypothetical protein
MHPWILEVGGNMGLDDIPTAKAMCKVLGLWFGAWETKAIHQALLTAPMPICRDEQRHNSLKMDLLRRTGPHTDGIMPMGLLQAPCDTVAFGSASSCALDGQSQGLQPLIQEPAGTINCCCVLEWRFGLGQDMLQQIGLLR